jgi:hypothetical protein
MRQVNSSASRLSDGLFCGVAASPALPLPSAVFSHCAACDVSRQTAVMMATAASVRVVPPEPVSATVLRSTRGSSESSGSTKLCGFCVRMRGMTVGGKVSDAHRSFAVVLTGGEERNDPGNL